MYRLAGVDPRADQRWGVYARSLLVFSAASVLLLYGILRIQALLPWALGMPGVPAVGAWNTAVSFVTNTNWQSYSGESDLGLPRPDGRAGGAELPLRRRRHRRRRRTDPRLHPAAHRRVGNFWVDLTRAVVRILLPLSFVAPSC